MESLAGRDLTADEFKVSKGQACILDRKCSQARCSKHADPSAKPSYPNSPFYKRTTPTIKSTTNPPHCMRKASCRLRLIILPSQQASLPTATPIFFCFLPSPAKSPITIGSLTSAAALVQVATPCVLPLLRLTRSANLIRWITVDRSSCPLPIHLTSRISLSAD